MNPPASAPLPPLLAELHRAIADDKRREAVLAASGAPGCKAARERMGLLTRDLLRLETGRPVR
jgi:hypothetical protein